MCVFLNEKYPSKRVCVACTEDYFTWIKAKKQQQSIESHFFVIKVTS